MALICFVSSSALGLVTPQITVVGLGPGGAETITRAAWAELEAAPHTWLRTVEHPSVAALPCRATSSFDALYERAATFPDVYVEICDALVEAALEHGSVVYAVPGDPCTAEQTVVQLRRRAARAGSGFSLRVLPGVSFVEPSLAAVGEDLLPATHVVDALLVAERRSPPFASSAAALVCQVYSRARASEVKLCLLAAYPPMHEVALLHYGGGPDESVERLPLAEIDRSEAIGALTSLYVPPLRAAADFGSLLDGLARLDEAGVASLPPPSAGGDEGEGGIDDEEGDGDGDGGDEYDDAPRWERVAEAARRTAAQQAAVEREGPGRGAQGRLEGQVAALLVEVLRQARRADELGYLGAEGLLLGGGDGGGDDEGGEALPGLAAVVARATAMVEAELGE